MRAIIDHRRRGAPRRVRKQEETTLFEKRRRFSTYNTKPITGVVTARSVVVDAARKRDATGEIKI